MSAAAKSVFVWGLYMLVAGTTIYFVPNVLLPLIDFPPTHEPWVRTTAAIVAILGYYYVQAARHGDIDFLRHTVIGRVLVLVAFGALVVFFDVRWELLVFAVPDQFGALWTWLALRRGASTA